MTWAWRQAAEASGPGSEHIRTPFGCSLGGSGDGHGGAGGLDRMEGVISPKQTSSWTEVVDPGHWVLALEVPKQYPWMWVLGIAPRVSSPMGWGGGDKK